VAVFHAVLEFLDAGPTGDNIRLYNYQDGKRDARARTRALSTLDSFILTLVKLLRNLSIEHFLLFVWHCGWNSLKHFTYIAQLHIH